MIDAPFDDLPLLTKRMKLDLVHGWKLEPRISNLLEVPSAAEVRSSEHSALNLMENLDAQVAHTHTPDRPIVPCLQEVLPHRQSGLWPTVWVMD